MSSDPTWLQGLQHATSYRQLQEAFDQMAAAIGRQGVDHQMASSIDEAIRRIEEERIRDQGELAEFHAQYAAFKGENAGVVGWFKRKLPFTATRKQDVELRDLVNDQEAEILADNFVIARAQMLKDSLLPPTEARGGRPSSYYREQLAAYDSVIHVRAFGQVLVDASRDIHTAEQFVAQLKSDIDAFAAARFAQPDDQQLQSSGLEKARAELAQLTSATEGKKKLVAAADDRLRQLVEQELAASNPEFQTLQQHLVQLTEFVAQCENTQPTLDARNKLLGQVKQKLVALHDIPAKAKSIETKIDKLQSDLRSAQSAFDRADMEYQPVYQRYEAARQAADQANMRVEATRPLVNAYLAEQGLDADSSASAASASPICAEYESLKAAAATGQAQLQQLTSLCETAKRTRAQAQSEVDKLVKAENELKLELSKLNQDRVALESEVGALCDQYRLGKLSFQNAIGAWSNKRAQVQWLPGLNGVETIPPELNEDLFGPALISSIRTHRDAGIANRLTDAYSRFMEQFQRSWKTAKAAQQQLTSDRKTALQQRSRLLLESELAARLF